MENATVKKALVKEPFYRSINISHQLLISFLISGYWS